MKKLLIGLAVLVVAASAIFILSWRWWGPSRSGKEAEILVEARSSIFSGGYSSLKICNPNDFPLKDIVLLLNDGRWSCDIGTIEPYASVQVEPDDFKSKDQPDKNLKSFERHYKLEIYPGNIAAGGGCFEISLSDLQTP